MTKFERLTLGLVAGAFALATAVSVQAADVSWRMAHKMPPDSPEGIVFQKFADLAQEYSGGKLEIKVYPNEQLGKTQAVLEQLKLGTVHLYAEGSTYMTKWVPAIKYISSSFLFDDRDHWVRFMNSDLVKDWFREASEQAGIGILGDPTAIVRGPYRVMVSKNAVESYDSVQALKLRMAPNKIAVETWTWLGADVKTLAWTDVYQAIDKGIVDAVNSPIALVESMRFYEVAPNVARHDEYYQSIGFMLNQKAYDKLSDDLKEAVNRAYVEAGQYSGEIMDKAADESIERMKANGVKFVSVDRTPFIDRMNAFYAERAKTGELPEGFLDVVEQTRKK